MLKDYRYVVEVGEALFGNVPQERQGHLSRLLSEAYLVLGDAAKAREYLGREDLNASTATDEETSAPAWPYLLAVALGYALVCLLLRRAALGEGMLKRPSLWMLRPCSMPARTGAER